METESVWLRAWNDTEHFRQSAGFFWLFEVVGAAMFGLIGTLIGSRLSPVSVPAQHSIYSVFGGGIGSVLGFIVVFAVIFIINLLRAPYHQLDEARKLYEPIEMLSHIKSGDIVTGKDINVSFMFQQLKADNLDNLTFDHCVLRGPCTLIVTGKIEFTACKFKGRGHPRDRLIKMESREYGGVGLFAHCSFNYCEFENLSFIYPEQEIKRFLDEVVLIPVFRTKPFLM